MKKCSKCGEEKSYEAFSARKTSKDGLRADCRACCAAHYRANRSRQLHTSWANSLKARYDMTVEQYEELLAAQGARCFICHRPPGKRRLAVDHDHRTGKVRGLLCSVGSRSCNWGLLASRDKDPEMFRRAYEYLLDPPAQKLLGPDHIAPGRPKRKKARPASPAQSDTVRGVAR